MQRRTTLALSALALVLGVVLVVETALLGGGIGFVFGGLLAVAGAGRLYVLRRK
jgi:hypothetical protein